MTRILVATALMLLTGCAHSHRHDPRVLQSCSTADTAFFTWADQPCATGPHLVPRDEDLIVIMTRNLTVVR